MEKGIRGLSPVLICFLLVSAGFHILLESQAQGQQRAQVRSGFCCIAGTIRTSDAKQCKEAKGTYFTTQAEAEKVCRAAKSRAQSTTTEKPVYQPAKGYCCAQGQINLTTEDSCKQKKGFFSPDKTKAERACIPRQGFCCANGSVSKSTREQCQKKKGTFTTDQEKAERLCAETSGFCCNNGKVSGTTKIQCAARNGKFSIDKAQAERTCAETKGFCCVNQKIHSMTKARCGQSGGIFALTRVAAMNSCNTTSKPTGSSRTGVKPAASVPGNKVATVAGSTVLPDLEVGRIWLDRSCVMQVDMRNNGGPIPPAQHSQARLHISAGPGNSLPEAQKTISHADPTGILQDPGGSLTFATGLVVDDSAQSLTWLDTAHHITESNEQNNGGYQQLLCKSAGKQSPLSSATSETLEPQVSRVTRSPEQEDSSPPPPPPPPPPDPGPEPMIQSGELSANQMGGLLSPKALEAYLSSLSFRVMNVVFMEFPVENETWLAALIVFNKRVDEASIVKGGNLRVLKEDNGFWYDASPSADLQVRVNKKNIILAIKNPITEGDYKIHLRGTLQSTGNPGEYLDCDKDGTPEGGQLPAYNSQIYRVAEDRILEW